MNYEKEILIALECLLKMCVGIPVSEDDLVEAQDKYLESTIKRIEEVIEGVKEQ